jgi:hypothetical protein
VRRERLRLWDDAEIRATEEWHPTIERAIARSRIALLLVSADFLASDYIADHELPTLVRHAVGLAPVLIADCFWREVPELAGVQWLHDIGRDGALSNHAGNPGARDRWIRRACERLLAAVPQPDPGTAPPLTIRLWNPTTMTLSGALSGHTGALLPSRGPPTAPDWRAPVRTAPSGCGVRHRTGAASPVAARTRCQFSRGHRTAPVSPAASARACASGT